jgi:hypothetical protein
MEESHKSKALTEIEIIRQMEMHSIQDTGTILDIVKYAEANPGNNDLLDRIDMRFSYAGLYPHAMDHMSFLPDNLSDEKKARMEKITSSIMELREKYKVKIKW